MNALKAYTIYLLMLIAAITNNQKMMDWLEGLVDGMPE